MFKTLDNKNCLQGDLLTHSGYHFTVIPTPYTTAATHWTITKLSCGELFIG